MRVDFTNNPWKQLTRAANLQAAQQSYVLWPPHREWLVDDWVELAGMECPTVDVVAPHLAPQARFIGVDVEEEVLERCRITHQGKPAEWVHGDLLDLVLQRAPCLDNVGVLNFDPFLAPGQDLESALDILGDFARERRRDASHFLLIVNVTTTLTEKVSHTFRWISRYFPRYLKDGHLPPDLKRCTYRSKTRPMVNVQVGFGFNPHKVIT